MSVDDYDGRKNTKELTCLDEWDGYTRLNKKMRLVRKYWHITAVCPFAISIAIIFHFFPNSRGWFPNALLGVSFEWAMLVVIYSLIASVRFSFVRCPRCGHRFGFGISCKSCALPRHAPGMLDLA